MLRVRVRCVLRAREEGRGVLGVRVREHRAGGAEGQAGEGEPPVRGGRVGAGEAEEDRAGEHEGVPEGDEPLGRDPARERACEADAQRCDADGDPAVCDVSSWVGDGERKTHMCTADFITDQPKTSCQSGYRMDIAVFHHMYGRSETPKRTAKLGRNHVRGGLRDYEPRLCCHARENAYTAARSNGMCASHKKNSMTIKIEMMRGAMTFPVPQPSEDPLVTAKMKRMRAPVGCMKIVERETVKIGLTSQERNTDHV